jgi:hypothetical protein
MWGRRHLRFPGRLALLGVLLALLGCGTPTGRPAGKITLRDRPVAGADLVFEFEQNPDERYFGLSDTTGAYHVSYGTKAGLPVGRYKVIIVHQTLPGGKPLPAGEEGDTLKSEGRTIQLSYRFEKDIQAGANAIDFELSQGMKLPTPRE